MFFPLQICRVDFPGSVPAAEAILAWHLAIKIAAARAAEGEASSQREQEGYERFLRRAVA